MSALPSSPDAERFVLGSILLNGASFANAAEVLTPEHFATDAHRRILRRIADIYGREEHVDRFTVCNELDRHGELQSVGGLSYLAALDDGLPEIPNLDSYIRILGEFAARRRILFACNSIANRVELGDPAHDIMTAAQDLFIPIAGGVDTYRSVDDIPCIAQCGPSEIEYITPELPRAAVVAFTGDSGCGKSTLVTALARDAWVQKRIPTLFLDRENPLGVIADRLARLGTEDGPGIRWWGGWLPTEAPMPDSTIVRDWVRERKGIVVVDSFSAFLEGDQNDASIVRGFLHRCRRLADLGALVIPIHHNGKAESAKDYRGSSDFKAAIDAGYQVSNFGEGGRLGKLVLRPFKSRMGAGDEITYAYADGKFIRGEWGEVRQTTSEQLTTLLRLNPGVSQTQFEKLAADAGIARQKADTFLGDGITSGAIRWEPGVRKLKRHFLISRG